MKIFFAIAKIVAIIASALGKWRNTNNAIRNSETKNTANAYDKVAKASKARVNKRQLRSANNNTARRESIPGRLREDKYQRD